MPDSPAKLDLRCRLRSQIQHLFLPFLRELVGVELVVGAAAADEVSVGAGFDDLARFDDEDLFSTMDAETRADVEQELLTRLRALPAHGLRIRLPVAYATARRPDRP